MKTIVLIPTKRLVLIPLYIYKFILSPLLTSLFGHGCRFSPTCSVYAIEVIEKYGILKGIRLSVIRLSKCHPFTKIEF